MFRFLFAIAWLPLLAVLSSCDAKNDEEVVPGVEPAVRANEIDAAAIALPPELLIGEWRLVRLETAEGEVFEPVSERPYSVHFTTAGDLHGQADCNRYRGEYGVEDASLTVGQLASTRAACPAPTMDHVYLAALQATDTVAVDERQLVITSHDGTVLRFERVEESAPQAGDAQASRLDTQVFVCRTERGGTAEAVVRLGAEAAELWWRGADGERHWVLPQVPAASGAKYRGDDVLLWDKGGEALVEIEGERFAGCEADRYQAVWADARLRGVDFRAVGNEPGWHLELKEGSTLQLVYDYGKEKIVVPAPRGQEQSGRTQYRVETANHELEFAVIDQPCSDSMSGHSFPATVTVTVDTTILHGCGRAL